MASADNDPAEDALPSTTISRREVIVVTGASIAAAGLGLRVAEAQPAFDARARGDSLTVLIRLVVNGVEHVLDVDPRQSILDVLRERLTLTGTKKGCNQGACGACTVLVNGKRANSCLTLAVMHDGASITTIEGLKQGDTLHPLQLAFVEHEGFQCGYCTSGQIMSGVACIAEGHAHSLDEIRFWMSGNICRCGAYPGICAAVHAVAEDS